MMLWDWRKSLLLEASGTHALVDCFSCHFLCRLQAQMPSWSQSGAPRCSLYCLNNGANTRRTASNWSAYRSSGRSAPSGGDARPRCVRRHLAALRWGGHGDWRRRCFSATIAPIWLVGFELGWRCFVEENCSKQGTGGGGIRWRETGRAETRFGRTLSTDDSGHHKTRLASSSIEGSTSTNCLVMLLLLSCWLLLY